MSILGTILSSAGDFATNWATNQWIDKPNASTAYDRQNVATAQAYKRTKNLNTIAWRRSKIGANTAYKRQKLFAKWQLQKSRENALMSHQRELDAFKSRYQMTVEDMAAAGLNPILAASGGFNVGSGVGAPMAQSLAPNVAAAQPGSQTFGAPQISQANFHPASTFSSSAKNMAAATRDEAQAEKNLAEVDEVVQNTAESAARTDNQLAQIIKTRAETSKLAKDEQETVMRTRKINQEIFKTIAETSETYSRINELQARTDIQHSEMEVLERQKEKLKHQTIQIRQQQRILKAQLARLNKVSTAYQGVGGEILGRTEAVLSTFGKIFGASTNYNIRGGN